MSESSGTKTSTVREPYMLDFHLWDAAQQPALSSLAVDGQTMTLGIRNTSGGDITLNELSNDHEYHFILRFRKGTLLNPANIRVEGPDAQWEKVDSTAAAPAHNVQEIYLRGPADHVIAPGETRVLELHSVQADPGPGTRNTRVEFAYQSLTFAERPLAGHREKTLSVTSVGGLMQPAVKQIPLHVGFGGSNTILNDGKSPNSLRVQLTNTDPQHNELRFPAGEPALARIILTFDVGDDAQRGWGLATRNELKTIEPTLHGGTDTQGQVVTWDFEFLSEAAREQWIFSPAVQTPISLAAGQALELSITNITSSLPSGPANLYLRCENIPGYPDRPYVLTVQKTPLVYGDHLAGIGTDKPASKLAVTDGLTVGTKWAAEHAASPSGLLVEGNVGIGVFTAQASLHVKQDGAGLAAWFEGGGGVDITGVTGAANALNISNNTTSAPTLAVVNNGAGAALYAKQDGAGLAAWFEGGGGVDITGVTGAANALNISNNTTSAPTLAVVNNGAGAALYAKQDGAGLAAWFEGGGGVTISGVKHGGAALYVKPEDATIKAAKFEGNVEVVGNVGIARDPETRLDVAGVVRAASFRPTNEMVHRMFPSGPKVYQNIFEAVQDGAIGPWGGRPQGYDDTTHKDNLWQGHRIINFGVSEANWTKIEVPTGYDTIWVRVLGERWTVLELSQGGRWIGGYRRANCYCPDGSLTDGWSAVHQWMPIPAGRSGTHYLRANITGTDAENSSWLSGLAFSKNPWKHATQAALGYSWAINDGDKVNWDTHDWKNDHLARLLTNTNYHLRVPVVPSGRDKLLYVVEHNSDWNGCMHKGITVNDQPIERFTATYDNPFARHWNSKFYNRYIAARIPAAFIPTGSRFLDVYVDMREQDHHIHFREIGTHDLDVPDSE